jgi:hypothetical protein
MTATHGSLRARQNKNEQRKQTGASRMQFKPK